MWKRDPLSQGRVLLGAARACWPRPEAAQANRQVTRNSCLASPSRSPKLVTRCHRQKTGSYSLGEAPWTARGTRAKFLRHSRDCSAGHRAWGPYVDRAWRTHTWTERRGCKCGQSTEDPCSLVSARPLLPSLRVGRGPSEGDRAFLCVRERICSPLGDVPSQRNLLEALVKIESQRTMLSRAAVQMHTYLVAVGRCGHSTQLCLCNVQMARDPMSSHG